MSLDALSPTVHYILATTLLSLMFGLSTDLVSVSLLSNSPSRACCWLTHRLKLVYDDILMDVPALRFVINVNFKLYNNTVTQLNILSCQLAEGTGSFTNILVIVPPVHLLLTKWYECLLILPEIVTIITHKIEIFVITIIKHKNRYICISKTSDLLGRGCLTNYIKIRGDKKGGFCESKLVNRS